MREMWRTPGGRGFIMLATMSACLGFAMSLHNSIVTNYLDEVLHFSGPQFGYWTAIREMGGLLIIFLTALLYRVSLQKLTAGAIVVVAVGYALFGVADSFWTVIPWTLLGSFGMHTVLQTQPYLGMSLTTESRSGSILGRMSAMAQVGTFAGLLMVYLLFRFHWLSYGPTFIILGVVAFLGALAIVRFPHLHEGNLREVAPKREPIVFRRAYRYYYWLMLLDGARQQVFFSFGLWVLVNHFGLDVEHVCLVLLAVTLGCILSVSRLARMVDRYGERRYLSIVNLAYVVALVGYALAPTVLVACLFYFIYALIAPHSQIGAATYLRKIAASADLAPSLSMGLTMNHVAAIIVPIAAGFILNYTGYQVPFYAACGVAVLTFFVCLRLDPSKQRCAARIAADEVATMECVD
jgi:predicted MFS family arabinose efflux permease